MNDDPVPTVPPAGPPQKTAADKAFNRPLADAALVACPDCDLVQRLPAVSPGASVVCARCARELWRPRVDPFNRTLAVALAALVCYLLANTLPMLGVDAAGRHASTTVLGGVGQLWSHDQKIVAGLVLLAVVVAPGLHVLFLLLILAGCRRERPAVWVGALLRHLPLIRAWSMIEVMLLGVFVALTKIAEMASVVWGAALFALFALVLLLAGLQSCFDPRAVWEGVAWARARTAAPAPPAPEGGVA